MTTRTRNLFILILFLLVVFTVSTLGAITTSSAVRTWYPTLVKPAWTPPPFLFGPVWTCLYAMMAVSAWLVWLSPPTPTRRAALTAFTVQLLLNAAWSPLFFGLRSTGLGLLDIVLLWPAILATLILSRRVRPAAAWLLVPYLAWSSFATALNVALWRLN